MSEQLSLVQVSNCTLTETGAQFDPQTSFETWIEAGQKLCRVSACVNWWIGDWLCFGISSYGDRSRLATEHAESLGLTHDAITNALYVSERVALSLRSESLSWSHHREVAPLKAKDQKHWLALASENKWSVSQLRQAIRASQAESKEDGTRGTDFSISAWAGKAVVWLRQRMNEKPIEQWPAAHRIALKEGLKPIVDVYERL